MSIKTGSTISNILFVVAIIMMLLCGAAVIGGASDRTMVLQLLAALLSAWGVIVAQTERVETLETIIGDGKKALKSAFDGWEKTLNDWKGSEK